MRTNTHSDGARTRSRTQKVPEAVLVLTSGTGGLKSHAVMSDIRNLSANQTVLSMKKFISLLVLACAVSSVSLQAQLKLPAIIGDHMVLQQKQADPIWGWDKPGATINV